LSCDLRVTLDAAVDVQQVIAKVKKAQVTQHTVSKKVAVFQRNFNKSSTLKITSQQDFNFGLKFSQNEGFQPKFRSSRQTFLEKKIAQKI